jgi:hypothetical protein
MEKPKKYWLIVECTDNMNNVKVLAGTEDHKAINTALSAINQYRQKIIQEGKLDLTDIRQSIVEEVNPINQILSQDEEEISDRLASMIDMESK